jgi:hypothetical protein
MSRTQPVLLFALLAVTAASGLQAQSLAEAAQKEAARRKEVKGAARVITNKDLPNVPPAAAAVASQPAPAVPDPVDPAGAPVAVAADAKDGQAPKDDVGSGKRDEKYWRDRLTKAKTDLEHDQIYVEALQSRINALTTDFVNRDDPAQRAVIATDRDKAIAELDRLKKSIIEKTRALAAIEEEARRAGVPPGWLR